MDIRKVMVSGFQEYFKKYGMGLEVDVIELPGPYREREIRVYKTITIESCMSPNETITRAMTSFSDVFNIAEK